LRRCLKQQTGGLSSKEEQGPLEEIPATNKNINEVIAEQADLM
jgi:hypothetical protein